MPKDTNKQLDYFTVCTPNYLHDSHIRYGLRYGANVICEKPLILNERNADRLIKVEENHDRKVYTILQLRHQKDVLKLKEKIDNDLEGKIHDIDLTYLTGRGRWYERQGADHQNG